jgi:hypothetical protein
VLCWRVTAAAREEMFVSRSRRREEVSVSICVRASSVRWVGMLRSRFAEGGGAACFVLRRGGGAELR